MSCVTKIIEEPISLLHLADHRQHALLHHDVERRGRLVGDDELRPADGGERDGHALAHAARQLVRIGVEHRGRQVQPVEMRLDLGEELRPRPRHVAQGEVDERFPHPPHRVEHVHRALHHVAQMLPADRRQRLLAQLEDVAVEEAVAGRAAQHVERRPVGAGDGLDEAGLAAARFAGEAVDLVALDVERDVVDRLHLARDAEILHLVVGAQVAHRQDRLRSATSRHLRPCG